MAAHSRFWQRAGMATAGVLFGFVVVNVALEVLHHPHVRKGSILAAMRGEPVDWRSKLTVVADRRRTGRVAYPAHLPSLLLGAQEQKRMALLPLSGVARVPTVLCNENGQWVIYESDRYGFNNDDTVYEAEGPLVLLLGDSYTQGWCVQPGEDVAGRLRQAGYRAINLGMGASGPLLQLAILQEYGLRLRPDTIVWLYFEGNDLSNLVAEARDPFLARYLQGTFTQDLASRQPEVDAALIEYLGSVTGLQRNDFWATRNIVRRLALLSRVREFLGLTKAQMNRPPPVDLDHQMDLFRAVLARGQGMARGVGAELVLVYLPDIMQLPRGILPSRDRVLQVARQMNICVVDFCALVAADLDPRRLLPFGEIGHYSAEGYALLAEAIEGALTQRLTISRSVQ